MKDIRTDPIVSGVRLLSRQQESGNLPSYLEIPEHACRTNRRQPTEWTQIPDWNYHYQHMTGIRHQHHRLRRHPRPRQRQLPQRAMQAGYEPRVLPDSVVEPVPASQYNEQDLEELKPKAMNCPL